jgi:flagellin-like hook-associated protein FlgL
MARKKIVEIVDEPNLVKDLTSGAVINTNRSAYEARIQARDRKAVQAETDLQQSKDIESLKADMAEIKKLLKSIASK